MASKIVASARPKIVADTDPRALDTPTDLPRKAVDAISDAVNRILADSFVLYLKTKNFHWHVSGPNFRDIHLMLDEQADAIFATTDPLAERVRKLSGRTLRSLSHALKLASLKENDAPFVSPYDMLVELMNDNKAVAKAMRDGHALCEDHHDAATASLLEQYIDETEKRTWFLFEMSRGAGPAGH